MAFKLWIVLRRGVDSRTPVCWELRSFEMNAWVWNHTLSATFEDSWRATMVTWTLSVSHMESSVRPSTYSTVTAARLTLASHIVHNHQSLFPGPNKSAELHDPHLSNHLIVLHSQTTLAQRVSFSPLQPIWLQFTNAHSCQQPTYMGK